MAITPFPRFRRMAFPQKLVQLRRGKGMSQQALADATGIHVTQIKRYEGGSAQPSMEALKKIAMALDCSTDALVFDESERPIADDLKRQFEAASRLPEEERKIVGRVDPQARSAALGTARQPLRKRR